VLGFLLEKVIDEKPIEETGARRVTGRPGGGSLYLVKLKKANGRGGGERHLREAEVYEK